MKLYNLLKTVFVLALLAAFVAVPVLAQDTAPTDLPGTATEALAMFPTLAVLVAAFLTNRITEWIKSAWTFLSADDRGAAAKISTDFIAALTAFGFSLLANHLASVAAWVDANGIWPVVGAVWSLAWTLYKLDTVRKALKNIGLAMANKAA